MNKRIKELVRESNLDVYGLGKEKYKWEYTVEKFAELLLQECMNICEDLGDKGMDGHYCVDKIRRELKNG